MVYFLKGSWYYVGGEMEHTSLVSDKLKGTNLHPEEITKRSVTKRSECQPFDGANEEERTNETSAFLSCYGCKITPSYTINVFLILPQIPRNILHRNLH